LSSKDVAAKYSVSRAWVDRVKQRRRETGEVAPRKQTKFRRRTLTEQQEHRLVFLITARPDATLAELRAQLPTCAALSTLWRTIGRLGLTIKKTLHADEQRRPDIATARRQWQDTQSLHDMTQDVFLDECGVTDDGFVASLRPQPARNATT
jgi:transposase